MFANMLSLLDVVVGGMKDFFNALSTDVTVLLQRGSNGFTRFLLTLLESINLDEYFAGVTLAEFLLGSGLTAVVVILIIYFFIP